jgi:AraC family transcriptional regulator, regulatory protein of adaptative response / DNA-3-methyladenine glycosylase II
VLGRFLRVWYAQRRSESVFAGSPVARSSIRREVLYWRAGKWRVLPANLPVTNGEGEECALFFDGGSGGGSGFSTLPALPAGVLAGNTCLEWHAEYGFAALRLIAESGLEGGVEGLAEQLGLGSRHLRRLFVRHLGATPNAVAQTRRLQFAKNLIDQTKLSMQEIAIASGFGCVRRFNAAIGDTYHRTPSQIRKLSRQAGVLPENQYFFRLRYRPPYDWEGMLRFLQFRATPGVEEVEGGVYRRSISFRGAAGCFEVSHDEENHSLNVRVQFADPKALYFIIERVRAMFDLNADWIAIARTLNADPELAAKIRVQPGLRVPGCWNGFELCVRAILGQQVTVQGATTLAGRLVKKFGQETAIGNGLTHIFPDPEILAEADVASIGLPRARGRTIREFARIVRDRQIHFESVLNSEALLDQLRGVAGFGRWTAQYIAMRALGDPDAFPSGDLGLMRKLGLKTARELELRAEVWRPWRAYGAMYIWSAPAETHLRKISTARKMSRPIVIKFPSVGDLRERARTHLASNASS